MIATHAVDRIPLGELLNLLCHLGDGDRLVWMKQQKADIDVFDLVVDQFGTVPYGRSVLEAFDCDDRLGSSIPEKVSASQHYGALGIALDHCSRADCVRIGLVDHDAYRGSGRVRLQRFGV